MFSKQGELDLARVLKALIDAGDIEPRPGFRGAGLVDHGPAGVRQGYAGKKWSKERAIKIKEAQKKGLTYDPITKEVRKLKVYKSKNFPDLDPKELQKATESLFERWNFSSDDFNKLTNPERNIVASQLRNLPDQKWKVGRSFEPLPKETIKEIKATFSNVVSEWKFDEGRYGIKKKGNTRIYDQIRKFVDEPNPWRLWASLNSPEGWLMAQFDRASVGSVEGAELYEPLYRTVAGKRKIAGFIDNSKAGGGKKYFVAEKWIKGKDADGLLLQTSHPDFKNTKKFYDIASKAHESPSKVITDILGKGGVNITDKRLTLNNVLNYLIDEKGIDNVKRAMVIHHGGGVFGSPSQDYQILNKVINKKIQGIESRMRENPKNILKEDIAQLKKWGASVTIEGKTYGAGPKTAKGGEREIQRLILEGSKDVDLYGKEIKGIKKWEPKDFNKFKKWLKKFPCMKADGGAIDIDCHIKGMRHEKNLLVEGKGSRALADKFLDGTKLARKGGALKTILGLGGLLGDLVFEGGYAAVNYYGGKDEADIWKHSWYSFMDPTLWKDGKYVGWTSDAEKQKQYEIRDEDGNVTGIRKNVKRYYDNVDKIEKQSNLYDNLWSAKNRLVEGQIKPEKEAVEAINKARTELSNFNTRINLEGGMDKIYKDLKYDQPYVDTRQETVDAQEAGLGRERLLKDFEKIKGWGGFSKDMEYEDKFDKPYWYKRRYGDLLEYKGAEKPSYYFPGTKTKDPRFGKPWATRGGLETDAFKFTKSEYDQLVADAVRQEGIDRYSKRPYQPYEEVEDLWYKWKKEQKRWGLDPDSYEDQLAKRQYIRAMGGLDLMDKIGLAGGVSKRAGGGLANLTRTVAPDSGPMSQGLRSLYIDDMD